MKTLARIAAALVLALAPYAAAQAEDLFTAPLSVAKGSTFTCQLLNVSTQALSVRVNMKGAGGNIIHGSGGNFSLAAGQVSIVYARTNPSGVDRHYCHFIVKGAKTDVRGIAAIRNSAGGDVVVVVAE
jgi:hypothetical protein